MNYPQFLHIESSCQEDGQYPIEIAWSLTDGSIKTVLVQPDDDWEPWDNASPELDVQHFMDHGETPNDIIRELNEDLTGNTVYVDGLNDYEYLVERLFEPCNPAEPDFEIAILRELFLGMDTESILDDLYHIAEQHNMDLCVPEHKVRAMLFLYANNN